MLDSAQRAAVAMNCHLLVPNLFWPATAGVEPYRDLAVPALETLLARGERARTAGASLERWLAAAFRAGPAREPPLAPLALLGEGVAPGADGWIAADPVHLKVHGTQLILADPSRLALTQQDAEELIATLNAHFAARGIEFIAPRPRHWYARTARAPQMHTTPTSEVSGKPIDPFLPTGEDGVPWRAVLNEVQMLLHEHPCNGRLEARGELPVNSVWFWGAGHASATKAKSPYRVVYSEHPLAAGLAAAGGATASALPESGAALMRALAAVSRGAECLALIELPPASAYGDVPAWREAVLAIERDWIGPVLAGWREKALESVTLHALGPDFGFRIHLGLRARYRFWRLRRPLRAYIG